MLVVIANALTFPGMLNGRQELPMGRLSSAVQAQKQAKVSPESSSER